jgi:hypothetical protein
VDPAHALWIGGSRGSGASSVAAALAERWELRLYDVDEHASAHAGRMPASADERWHARHRFRLVLEDLRAWPDGTGCIVAGPQLFPTSVAAVLADPRRALFLLSADSDARPYEQEARDLRLAVLRVGASIEETIELAARILPSGAGGTSR